MTESKSIILELKELLGKGRYNAMLLSKMSPSAEEDYKLIDAYLNSDKLDCIELMLQECDS